MSCSNTEPNVTVWATAKIMTSSTNILTIRNKTINFKCKMPTTLESFYTTFNWGKDEENKWVFSLVLNVRRQSENVTSDGRLFQIFAAATGNARSLIVESRVSGTLSAEVDDQRRRCRPGIRRQAAKSGYFTILNLTRSLVVSMYNRL